MSGIRIYKDFYVDYKDFYVDYIGYELKYNLGEREMGVIMTGDIYWHFNGFLKLTVL